MNDELIDLEKLGALEARVANLPRAIDPPDVWSEIRAAIQTDSITPISGAAGRAASTRFWQRPGFMIAATAAIIAATSASTVIALRRDPVPVIAQPASFVQFATRENNYIETASRLQSLVESDKSTLSPETVAKLRKSIAIIDAAIMEARQALAADPANKELMDMLSSSYDKKVDLLRRSEAMGRT